MARSLAVGFIPFVGMLVGVPFVNSDHEVIGIPLLGLWILAWVIVTPLFLLAAHRLLPEQEREESSR